MSFACKCWNRFSNQPGNPLFACVRSWAAWLLPVKQGQLSAQWPNKHWESWISISDQHSVKYLTSGKPQRKSSGLLVGCIWLSLAIATTEPHMVHGSTYASASPFTWSLAYSSLKGCSVRQQCLLIVLLDSKLRHGLVTHHAFQSFLQCHKNLCCNAFFLCEVN